MKMEALDAITRPRVFRLFAVVVVAWLPALLGREAISSVAALYPLANSANPYFVAKHAALPYICSPIVVASACFLFLSPGLFLSLALDGAKGVAQWVLTSLAISLVVVSVTAGIVQSLSAIALRGEAFAVVVVVCSLLCFGFLLLRLTSGRTCCWPLSEPAARSTLLSLLVVPVLILLCLTPKFYWENFNGDGVQAFEVARILFFHPLPFWDPSAGSLASYPGFTMMLVAFPESWFLRFFGDFEASVRLPFLLQLVALYCAVLAVVEHGRSRTLGLADRLLIWWGLTIYAVVMAFSATYSPYSADISSPATRETLLMACFLGSVMAFLQQERGWMVLFILLCYLSVP